MKAQCWPARAEWWHISEPTASRRCNRRADEGDEQAALIVEGCSYQTAKEIGAMAAVLRGEVDAIILTGGLAYDQRHVERITGMVKSIAPIFVYPGEDELKALAFNGFLAVTGTDRGEGVQGMKVVKSVKS
ncbi:MAG: hypothetical protein MZV63_22740 [Marinilabiliales bacterium]|nr:hypothetical protein [Marinilabiliales bacterium]